MCYSVEIESLGLCQKKFWGVTQWKTIFLDSISSQFYVLLSLKKTWRFWWCYLVEMKFSGLKKKSELGVTQWKNFSQKLREFFWEQVALSGKWYHKKRWFSREKKMKGQKREDNESSHILSWLH